MDHLNLAQAVEIISGGVNHISHPDKPLCPSQQNRIAGLRFCSGVMLPLSQSKSSPFQIRSF